MRNKLFYCCIAGVISAFSMGAAADDVDIYKFSTYRPMVLILFDDSGSMRRAVDGNPTSVMANKKITIAKDAVIELINDNSDVDFGLMSFIAGTSKSEGSYKAEINKALVRDMTSTQRTELVAAVNGLGADTWTPLCETYAAAYKYFTSDFDGLTAPARTVDCEWRNIIYMTDGDPSKDYCSSGSSCKSNNGCYSGANMVSSPDPISSTDPRIHTFSVAFGSNINIMKSLALKDDGSEDPDKYFLATDKTELKSKFQEAMDQIRAVGATSVTAPTTVNSTSDLNINTNAIYLSGFSASNGKLWKGNVKKYTITDGKIVRDPNDKLIEGGFGQAILDGFKTGTDFDGKKRKLFIDTAPLATGYAHAFESADGTYSTFKTTLTGLGVAEEVVQWAVGATETPRDWVIGDILHAQPIVVNYGCTGTGCTPDVRVVFGTNQGFLHMFQENGTSQTENWAFSPRALWGADGDLMLDLKGNQPATHDGTDTGIPIHPYGVDGPITVYLEDGSKPANNSFKDADDKAYLFFGMRRGGQHYEDNQASHTYYAIDIKDPDRPTLLWTRTVSGQSWSKPVVTYMCDDLDCLNGPQANKRLAVIVGGGYDYQHFENPGNATPVPIIGGNYVSVWNATTGGNFFSGSEYFSAEGGGSSSIIESSVVAEVSVLDSNGDGVTDRIYTGDLDGNVYRGDIGIKVDSSGQNPTFTRKLQKIADVDGKIFDHIDVVRTFLGGQKIDALFFGTGDHVDVKTANSGNYLYMLIDENTHTSFDTFSEIASSDLITTNGNDDKETDLITGLQSTTAQKKGWMRALRTNERAWNRPITLAGVTFFTTFIPPTSTTTSACGDGGNYGDSYLYAILSTKAKAAFGGSVTALEEKDTEAERTQLTVEFGSGLPGAVAVHLSRDSGNESEAYVGPCKSGEKCVKLDKTLSSAPRSETFIHEE